jgi:DeoR family glycerol-3-phosphate regulon repressor
MHEVVVNLRHNSRGVNVRRKETGNIDHPFKIQGHLPTRFALSPLVCARSYLQTGKSPDGRHAADAKEDNMSGAGQPSTHANHREREILEELRLAGGASRIHFLANRLSVSEETIRRNIRTLEANGLVTKVHGGVHINDTSIEQPLHHRMRENSEAKRLIAAEVAGMIKNGDTLFLDIGSTTAFIVAALQKHQQLFVVTNAVSVAHALAARNGNRVFFSGGELRSHDGGAFGLEAITFLRRFNVRHAILTVGAVNASAGFMLHDYDEAELSREAGRHAENRIIVADSNKFGRTAPIVLDAPSNYDMLVTDSQPSQDIRDMLAANDVELVVAGNANPA